VNGHSRYWSSERFGRRRDAAGLETASAAGYALGLLPCRDAEAECPTHDGTDAGSGHHGDYRCHSLDGLAALALVKEKGLDLPFIIVSGYITEETAVAPWKGRARLCDEGQVGGLGPAVERELREPRSARSAAARRKPCAALMTSWKCA